MPNQSGKESRLLAKGGLEARYLNENARARNPVDSTWDCAGKPTIEFLLQLVEAIENIIFSLRET